MSTEAQERILCAALYIDTGFADPVRRSHAYPKTGLVFCGWRHASCFTSFEAWADLQLDPKEAFRDVQQGFLTSTGRYVDRTEGCVIALAANQIVRWDRGPNPTTLYSEDLY